MDAPEPDTTRADVTDVPPVAAVREPGRYRKGIAKREAILDAARDHFGM